MNSKIVHSDAPVLLVGGGECAHKALIADISETNTVVAADGGAQVLLDLGHVPDAVIGDMDSLSPESQARIPPARFHPIAEQDSTDFDKALRHIQAPLIIGHGFLGARLDHQLAAMTVLTRRADRPCTLIGAQDVVCVAPPSLTLELPLGSRLSLFPMAPITGRSQGLRWPIEGIKMAPDGRVSTSNEVSGPVTLEFQSPHMLLILPRAAWPMLRPALLGAPRWPARAG